VVETNGTGQFIQAMQVRHPLTTALELDAAVLQAVITAGLALLCLFLYRRYRKAHFAWFAAAWSAYALRLVVIMSFLVSGNWIWLYWHQVLTGWTALGLLWGALVVWRGMRFRREYLLALLVPPVWSYIAIYRVENFFLAAGPAVAFLSLATLWTGWVFYRYWRQVGSTGALALAIALTLWGLHHLDYPFLRARGAWAPWGYYLDIVFTLATGAGILLLVIDDLTMGLDAMSDLAEVLQHRGGTREVLDAILARPLSLPAVRGSALYLRDTGRVVRASGACAGWEGQHLEGSVARAVAEAVVSGHPQVADGAGRPFPYAAVVPVSRREEVSGALILVGEARDPFTALDDRFLEALGRQVGAALENADLSARLQQRSTELERLSKRMLEQHEEERRRLSRELHDETAQVFSAVKMELSVFGADVRPEARGRLDRLMQLVDTGIRGIRSVVNDLRPSLLDDLGLLPALRSLVAQFAERSGLAVGFDAPRVMPTLSKEAELAVFRALQEALSNVARHAEATRVDVQLRVADGELRLTVTDDGRGPESTDTEQLEREGHMGLTGMRERLTAVGGRVAFDGRPGEGARLEIQVPVHSGVPA
jgi:signal transduction histidine kinase